MKECGCSFCVWIGLLFALATFLRMSRVLAILRSNMTGQVSHEMTVSLAIENQCLLSSCDPRFLGAIGWHSHDRTFPELAPVRRDPESFGRRIPLSHR